MQKKEQYFYASLAAVWACIATTLNPRQAACPAPAGCWLGTRWNTRWPAWSTPSWPSVEEGSGGWTRTSPAVHRRPCHRSARSWAGVADADLCDHLLAATRLPVWGASTGHSMPGSHAVKKPGEAGVSSCWVASCTAMRRWMPGSAAYQGRRRRRMWPLAAGPKTGPGGTPRAARTARRAALHDLAPHHPRTRCRAQRGAPCRPGAHPCRHNQRTRSSLGRAQHPNHWAWAGGATAFPRCEGLLQVAANEGGTLTQPLSV